jgi:hypothetical protein
MIKLFSILLSILILSSCSLMLPPHINVVDSPYPREEVLMAVDDFIQVWEQYYDEDVSIYMNDITIYFYGKTQEEWASEDCYQGTTSNQYRVNVAYINDIEYFPLYHTAIWHEFVHLMLWNLVDDPDYDHEKGDGPWTDEHNQLVGEIKVMWQERIDAERAEE